LSKHNFPLKYTQNNSIFLYKFKKLQSLHPKQDVKVVI